MAVKKLMLPKNNELLMSSRAADLLMDCGDGQVALLYLYILSRGGEFDDISAATRLKISRDEVSAALDILTRQGLIEQDAGSKPIPDRADTLPEYTATDIASTIEKDDSFKYLLDYTQKRLGKLLSTVDTQTLLGIYNWMGLPVDVICLLITCCVNETKKKFGEGRVPTMRSIEQRARLWTNLEIMSQSQAEEYLREQERHGTRTAQIARLLHIGGRALSPTENRYISCWVDLKLSDDLILKAYDITVIKTGGLKWKYLDTILKSWHGKGYTTAEQVEKGEAANGGRRANSSKLISEEEQKQELDSIYRLRELNRARRGNEA